MMHHRKHICHHTRTVDDLKPGDRGVIVEILADEAIRQRLMDLGIIEGVEVEMIRPAPFGDPLQVKVLDTSLALRRSEASMLVIDTDGEQSGESPRRHCHCIGRKSQLR